MEQHKLRFVNEKVEAPHVPLQFFQCSFRLVNMDLYLLDCPLSLDGF